MFLPLKQPGSVVVYLSEREAALVRRYTIAITEAMEGERAHLVEDLSEQGLESMAQLVGGMDNAVQLAEVFTSMMMQATAQYEANQVRKN